MATAIPAYAICKRALLVEANKHDLEKAINLVLSGHGPSQHERLTSYRHTYIQRTKSMLIYWGLRIDLIPQLNHAFMKVLTILDFMRTVVLYIDSLKIGGAERVTQISQWLNRNEWNPILLTRRSGI